MTRRDGRKGRRAASGGAATISAGTDASQLLPMAVHEHGRGNLARARLLYEQILAAQPEHADALHYLGVLCHQRGEAQRAEDLIRRAIALNPRVAPYHDNLGTVLEHAGRLDEACAAYEDADALEPDDADRGYNLGLVLYRLGRLADAEQRLRDALQARPQDAECRFALANVLKLRGERAQAHEAYRQVLEVDPSHARALVNLGNLLLDEERLEEAARCYRQVLERVPDDAAALHNLGRLLRRQGRLEQAQHSFEQALRTDPGLAEARLGLARTLEDRGQLARALAAYRAACESPQAPPEARAGLLRVVRVYPPVRHDVLVARELLAAIEQRQVHAPAYARALGLQLAAMAGISGATPLTDAQALRLALDMAHEPLFEVLAQRCVNVVPEVERWLTAARRELLLHGVSGGDADADARRTLLHLLAMQCIANEHVFAVTDEEAARHAELRARLAACLCDPCAAAGDLRDEEVALAACYAALADLAGVAMLIERTDRSHWLWPVLERSVSWPLAERELAAALPTLAPIADPASRLVRGQYEQNPYPRWHELPPARDGGDAPVDPFHARLAARRPLDILVAGCGTGQEPLALASRFPGHRLVALDLSCASLAYGMRMARALGIRGVQFVHGDLLHVGALGRRFDLITASGVLHHMADPAAGWRALVGCLAADGLMKVGLYSRRARATVNVARERIQGLASGSDAHAVRALRQSVLDGSQPDLVQLLDSEDFYATSTCRDLLLHPVEHQFDLLQVAAMLESLGLRFAGFELPHPLIARAFGDAGVGAIDDLRAWDRFEQANPDTFQAMYVLWCANARTDPDGSATDA